jgi:hypothetical protein
MRLDHTTVWMEELEKYEIRRIGKAFENTKGSAPFQLLQILF